MNVLEKSLMGIIYLSLEQLRMWLYHFWDDCAICFLNREINTGRGVGWWITWACSNGLVMHSYLSSIIKNFWIVNTLLIHLNIKQIHGMNFKNPCPYEVLLANPLLTPLVFEAVLLNTSTGDPHCSLAQFSVVNIVKLQLSQSSAGCVLIKTRERERPSHWL